MHEATIAHAILQRVSRTIEAVIAQDARRTVANPDAQPTQGNDKSNAVSKISVEVGEFRNVDPESLEFAFTSLRADFKYTHQADLDLRMIPVVALCIESEHQFRPHPDSYFSCTICGAAIGKLLRGNELDIVAIETGDKIISVQNSAGGAANAR